MKGIPSIVPFLRPLFALLPFALVFPALAGTPLKLERSDDATMGPAPRAAAGEESLNEYLDREFPGEIREVDLRTASVHVSGRAPAGTGDLFLADIPMDLLVDDPSCFEVLIPVKADAGGAFTLEVPRKRKRSGREYDRLVSRWQLVSLTEGKVEPLSYARHADKVACRSPGLETSDPRNKKGLGGWHSGLLPGEVKDLGISAVTINVMIHTLVSADPEPDTWPFIWQGRTYHANIKALEGFDRTLIEAAKHKLMVSAILLVGNPARDASPLVRALGHPDAVREGIFAMPNVTSVEGIDLYGAILNLMAGRWSRPDGKYGRIHHWIVHNEVDAGWVWTNAGEKSALVYMDLYQRSMRLVDLIARQYDPHGSAFISLTHHWAWQGSEHWYGSRRMIELLHRFCRAEGDFPWALAFHPYPQDLNNPRTWEDDTATFSFDSRKITPRNIEVLDAWMHRPEMRYHGELRPVPLSENGFNSRDYSEKSLEDQAAGMAYVWKKMGSLESIQMWHYHNWIDNRGEDGLRIGLRKFPDESGDPLGRKPIWFLYKALGTPLEPDAADPYLGTVGLESWQQALQPLPW